MSSPTPTPPPCRATRAAALRGERAPASRKTIADGFRVPYGHDAEHRVFQRYAGYRGATVEQVDTVLLVYPLERRLTRRAGRGPRPGRRPGRAPTGSGRPAASRRFVAEG
ncbi:hypothetical protein [Streptomyces celluloflavus]|uniref:hypothetical protein n=1 Tax=Streptomyces celluloflavus TaxID=58344 RepID=UPI0034614D8F|nr:hypothetical protein OG717_12845 [Streptomyces celluloflavus]